MNVEKEFIDSKEQALKSLEKAHSENKVDPLILSLLNIINNSDEYYTSSSCSGRIVLLEIPNIGDKKHAKFLGKWHQTMKPNDVLAAVKKAKTGMIWLLAQSPIIHIAASNNKAADKLVKNAVASGFKNSSLKSTNKKIICEICSTERLDAPIGKDGKFFCNEDHLQLLVDIANEVMEKSTAKLHRFEQKLRKCLSTHKTTQ